MAETFMFSIAEQVLERLGSFIVKQIGLASSVKNDLRDFVDTLSDIKCVLLHAEVKQAENPNLKLWLRKLRDVCYDAEDMIDEYEYEVLWQQEATHRSFKNKVLNFFSHSCIAFSVSMADKLSQIKNRLKDIATNKDDFHLDWQDQDRRVVHIGRETHYFVHASDVIGRDDDREKIIPDLMSINDDENVSVIPIVGIGGLGKTTFAKLLYNDERVVGHFHIKIWVYAYFPNDQFDVKMLMEKIITSAANTSNGHDLTLNNIMQTRGNLTLNDLQTCLRNILRGKKYLIILDDVWNQDRAKWIDLKNLLMEGASGSKIIVTTRSESVASIVGTVDPYKLEGLLEKQCLELFVKWAFREGEENQYPELLKIGEEIVKKCSRVPLEVRTLGSLLYLKRDVHDWKDVKDSKMWKLEQKEDDILPSLKLSYDNLPSHLKQCFAFCHVFPKGYKLNSLELIPLWIAQGLLYSSDENTKLEDIGRQYIKELSLRSFFQNVEEYGIVLTFEMHDLIHDLASFVAETSKTYSGSDRHVSISIDSPLKEVSLPKQNNVRTIIFPVRGTPNKSFAKTCISRFKYLRVLDLRDSHFEVLPSSIRNLKLLRYLNLYNSSLKKLPSSICDLLYLQTLDLSKCTKLEEVPKDIGNLIHLRCLYITTKQVFLPEEGIGRLKSLRFLGIVECSNLKTLGWVQHLTALQTLLIEDCRSLESLPNSMQGLSALETLFIYNCAKLNLMEWEKDNQGCSLSLRSSWFASLPQLVALPEWLKWADNSLQHLCIGDCKNFTTLPEWLQNLTSLQKLVIEDCPEFSALPEGMDLLCALRDLKIKRCPKLGIRWKRVIGEDWPKIAHVKKITLDEEISDVAGTSEPRND